ncbi:MAG TPA: nuclear transport factor 2 family protein [Ramlibacter sp.]|nr:nuclear transport factor 2 family protein [Ramlibacter sp.]
MNDATPPAAQLRTLHDIEAIRRLKASYFAACDGKDAPGMAACFAEGEVLIDYGAVGVFHHRDQLASTFQRLACHPHIVEMHHGANPMIEIVDEHEARGRWSLHYQQIDMQANRLTQLGGRYEDEYRRIAGAWRISRTRFVVDSTLVLDLGGDAVRRLA